MFIDAALIWATIHHRDERQDSRSDAMKGWDAQMNTAERVRHLSVAEYHMMGEAGIFAPDERVELIKGVVHSMTPIGATHSWTVNLVARAFMAQFGAPYIVAVQNKRFVFEPRTVNVNDDIVGLDFSPSP